MFELNLRALAAVLAAPLAQAQPAPPCPLPQEPRSFFVFVFDDLGLADLETFPHPTIDALAAQGLTFSQCYGSPVCSPSRHQLQFGEWWTRIADDEGEEAPSSAVSLAELLHDRSSLYLGKWHLGGTPIATGPMQQGYDDWRKGITTAPSPSYFAWNVYDSGSLFFGLEYLPLAQAQDFATLWPAMPWPRLAVYATSLPHLPYHRPPSAWLPSGYPSTATDRLKFQAMGVAADEQLRRALEHVDLSRTFVVLVGDNGTPAALMPDLDGDGDADVERGKTSIFERGIRVPLVIAGPGVPAGVTTDALCSVVDVRATLCDLAGHGDPGRDGRSLRPVLEDPSAEVRSFVLAGVEGDPRWPDQVTVRLGRYKLNVIGGTEALYDLETDPHEFADRSSDPTLQAVLQDCRNVLAANRP